MFVWKQKVSGHKEEEIRHPVISVCIIFSSRIYLNLKWSLLFQSWTSAKCSLMFVISLWTFPIAMLCVLLAVLMTCDIWLNISLSCLLICLNIASKWFCISVVIKKPLLNPNVLSSFQRFLGQFGQIEASEAPWKIWIIWILFIWVSSWPIVHRLSDLYIMTPLMGWGNKSLK